MDDAGQFIQFKLPVFIQLFMFFIQQFGELEFQLIELPVQFLKFPVFEFIEPFIIEFLSELEQFVVMQFKLFIVIQLSIELFKLVVGIRRILCNYPVLRLTSNILLNALTKIQSWSNFTMIC